jgi:hypothetical protein
MVGVDKNKREDNLRPHKFFTLANILAPVQDCIVIFDFSLIFGCRSS